jgi:trk system potassium uptake protein TrkH
MALSVELSGAVLLVICWWGRFDSVAQTVYYSVFHAISAFCNAGFSTFSDSLVQFRFDLATNAIVAGLIVIGGIGFMAVRDLLGVHSRRNQQGRRVGRLRVQTRVVLGVSALLLVAGTVLFYVTENHHQFAGMAPAEAWLASAFQSVTMRTAGFNTCDMSSLTGGTILVALVLMFIGASPGSTGGGVKTTTVAVLSAAVAGVFRNREHTELARRTIPDDVVRKALSLLCISIGVVFVFALLLLHVEQKPFRDILFETVSAFGTVGVSTGITPDLTPTGKMIVTALMFIGRLGPLTIAYAFVRERLAARYEYAEERVMIG